MILEVGQVIRFERIFTADDVKRFTEISGDAGNHHTKPNEVGNYIVQGLLTATLPTKVGGDYNVLARSMNFEFLRPVFTNEKIICEVIIDQYEKKDDRRMAITTSFHCKNEEEKLVLEGDFSGVILSSSLV